MDDTEIIELFFERSPNALKQISEKYGKLCLRLVRNILGNDEDAEEILNDVLSRLWKHIPPLRPQNLKAYVCRIARNAAVNRVEKENAAKRGGNFAQVQGEWLEMFPNGEDIASEVALKDIFERFLDSLGEEERSLFVRRYWFADSVKDVAAFYALSESRVKSSLFRTRNKMREFLAKEGFTV